MKRTLIYIVSLISAALCVPATAQDWAINLTLGLKHLTGEPPVGLQELNDDVQGIGLQFNITDELYIKGGMLDKNSYFEPSNYLGAGTEIFKIGNTVIGGEVIVADGYGKYAEDELRPPQETRHFWGAFVAFGDRHGPKIGYAGKLATLEYQLRFH